jgi:hypothetical protein
MDKAQIVCNRIRTPDGTILQSHHRHDYVTYIDKNGLEYMVDGGNDYLRRNVHEDAPYTEMSLTMNDSFEDIREAFTWGTRGKDGKQPLTWISLCMLETDHIIAILETQNLADHITELFEKELEYRVECDA